MSQEKPVVAIVGLGLIGASMGLALRKAAVASQVVGHDSSAAAASQARKLGAVDRTEWNLVSACEKRDLVILAIPFVGIQDTLQAIGPYLRPGCVVVDTAPLARPVLEWADAILPEQVHFVGLDPILGGTAPELGGLAAARADLFERGLVCVMPSGRASSEAVQVALDLITILGARPLFCDPLEHDSLLAAVDLLPRLVSYGLLETVIHEPAWRELRKVAGPLFVASTQGSQADPAAFGALLLANRDNLLRWLGAFSAALDSLRDALAGDETEALARRLQADLREHDHWLQLRSQGLLDEGLRTEMPPKQSLLQPLFGGLWPRRRKPEKKA